MTAHQYLIRERMKIERPRPQATSLEGYSVETISRADAAPIIAQYEYLGTFGRTTLFVGLLSPSREIEGVACFGHGHANISGVIGSPALCLERGACVHYAPSNAASFLINTACKLICRISGNALFFAYGDPNAGEYGAVYQAAGWVYLGQGLDKGKQRRVRRFVLAPGADPDNPAAWKTTHALRQGGRDLTFAAARALGWRIAWRQAKHVYAVNVGRDRKRWRKQMLEQQAKIHGHALSYPAPRPELKRKPRAWPSEPVRMAPIQNAHDLFT